MHFFPQFLSLRSIHVRQYRADIHSVAHRCRSIPPHPFRSTIGSGPIACSIDVRLFVRGRYAVLVVTLLFRFPLPLHVPLVVPGFSPPSIRRLISATSLLSPYPNPAATCTSFPHRTASFKSSSATKAPFTAATPSFLRAPSSNASSASFDLFSRSRIFPSSRGAPLCPVYIIGLF